MDMNLLREWVIAEIEYSLAQREEGEDGYRSSAHGDRDVAQMAFDKLCAAQQTGAAELATPSQSGESGDKTPIR